MGLKMTSQDTASSTVLELKQSDYQKVLDVVKTYLRVQNTPAGYREVAETVAEVITPLAQGTPDPYFYPFKKGTFFYEKWAKGFSKLHIFSSGSTEPVEIESQIFWLYNFIYAFRLESIYQNQGLNDLDIKILTIPKRTQLPDFAAAQIEIFRASVTAALTLDSQNEIRKSLRSESEASAARLGSLVSSITTWEEKLDYWKDKTANLEKLIKEQHQDLNFVGLSKAFSDLIQKRVTELKAASRSVKLFGFVAILFPVIVFFVGVQYHSTNKFDWSVLSYAIPSLTIELLLLYFFRIALRNEYSIKAQLLQLELRYSICAFIQGYAEFAKSVRADDADKTLEKFEAFVFSGITADIQNIPSQFDGLEQIVSLIKGMRGKE